MNQEGESEGEKDRIRYGEAFKPKVMVELRDGKFKSVKESAMGYGIAGRLMGRLSENPTTLRFSLSADGKFGIAKYQFFAERDIHNNVWTNGIRMVR